MNRFYIAAMVTAAAFLSCNLAKAAEFSVTPLEDGTSFTGCLAQNEKAGVGFLAVGDSVVLFANSTKFQFSKGDDVTGSWSVDGGTATEFASKADSANTASLDVPNTTEAVTSLTTGKQLTVTANKVEAQFSLAGGEQAFMDLTECMEKHKAM